MDRKFVVIFGFLVVSVSSLIGGFFGRIPSSGTFTEEGGISAETIKSDYKEAIRVIEENYAGSIDYEKLSESSIQSMLWSLDPHSSFLNRAEFKRLREEQSSRFFGIGVSILRHRDGVYIQSVIPGTPAEKAGLRYGDKFLEVDGKDATGWSSAEVSKNVRGERGTTVRLKMERAGEATPLEFEIVRDGVPLPSIRNYFMLKDDVGYIGLIGGFQETTAVELDKAIESLKKQGMKQLILDLRNNPGGLLPQAVEVASRFIPKGKVIVSVKGRSRYAVSEDLLSRRDRIETFPLVVLINGASASASEIVAGAVQDHGRGLVVGTESFGKGLVQKVFELPMGAAITLTTARYYTPFGRSLQRDYSNGSIYDYYVHHLEDEEQKVNEGQIIRTADGRTFYSGRGITPDVKVEPLEFDPTRYRINESIFYFTRLLVAGKIAGLESYRVERQKNISVVQPGEFPVTEKLLNAFREFVEKDKLDGLTVETINKNLDYVKVRLRQEIVTASYSSEAGAQVFLEIDPQVRKAVEVLPEAKKLAERTGILKNFG
ncbi:MAG: S41 family peptidase [Pyrinomonadaceae bacterium]|nr:S41 family peptidase [Pyrinomonadaceae bacterium]MCX7638911.1 S41 family peptidase [Pyrinomonadaceae bacterium]MDW8304952.1 S41 family peptidase [Acidobacteriota bacterium]